MAEGPPFGPALKLSSLRSEDNALPSSPTYSPSPKKCLARLSVPDTPTALAVEESCAAAAHIVARQLFAQINAAALFLQEWVQRPQQIGAIFPSSKNLSVAMANWIPVDPDEFVLELGPGTGSVTEAMLTRGLRHDRLIALEMSPRLADLLRARFPRAHIITGDALNLDKVIRKQVRHVDAVGAVISSLPLRNFKPEDASLVAQKIYSVLRPGGVWVQFSYHLATKEHKGDSSFNQISSDIVWRNFPPARICVYQRPLTA